MTTTCSNGHASKDSEWCDVCGEKLGAGGSAGTNTPGAGPSPIIGVAPSGSTPGSTSQGSTPPAGGVQVPCPHCGDMNTAANLFCESCGYDFTTGQAPPADPPVSNTVAPAVASAGGSAVQTVPVATIPAEPATTVSGWIVIVEIDPEWFAAKGADAGTPCPPASSSTVALTSSPALVGRTSQSKGVYPAVALDLDPAVSRRHAQFVFDHDHWTVIDLGSSNGTYVLTGSTAASSDEVPLASGVATKLADGDRVYVGAWTRITLRRS
jgi:hypothetical protein